MTIKTRARAEEKRRKSDEVDDEDIPSNIIYPDHYCVGQKSWWAATAVEKLKAE